MIKTVPYGTVSPQMMYKKYKRLVCTSPDLLARFCKINCKLVERKKLGLIRFPRNCFPTLGSRGYFFLIETDGSRRSRVNEALFFFALPRLQYR